MFGYLFKCDQLSASVDEKPIDGTIRAAEPDGPLSLKFAVEGLIMEAWNSTSLRQSLPLYHLNPRLKLDDDVPGNLLNLSLSTTREDDVKAHITIVH